MDFDTNELVNTVVHQAHVIRRLENALADTTRRLAALEAPPPDDVAPLASADERTDTQARTEEASRGISTV